MTQQHFQRVPSVKNKRAGGRPTRSCSSPPSCHQSPQRGCQLSSGGTGAHPSVPSSRQVTLSEMLPETHAIYTPYKYCHGVVVWSDMQFRRVKSHIFVNHLPTFYFFIFLVCYCCELNVWHPPCFPRLSPNNYVDIFPHNASNSSFKS